MDQVARMARRRQVPRAEGAGGARDAGKHVLDRRGGRGREGEEVGRGEEDCAEGATAQGMVDFRVLNAKF